MLSHAASKTYFPTGGSGAHLRIASSGRPATALATAETSQSRWTARPTSEVTRQGKPKLRLQVLPALQLEEIGARSENLGLPKINLATVSAVDCISSREDFGRGKFHQNQ